MDITGWRDGETASQIHLPTTSATSYCLGNLVRREFKTASVDNSRFRLCFETDDGRTFAGADASFKRFEDFIAFLKPLSVTLPLAARFTLGAGQPSVRESAINKLAKANKRDRIHTGAIFEVAPDYRTVAGAASSQR